MQGRYGCNRNQLQIIEKEVKIMEAYVIAILALVTPFLLIPVALVWYLNIAGMVAYFKDTAKVKEAVETYAQV
jgi:hypothetical protein